MFGQFPQTLHIYTPSVEVDQNTAYAIARMRNLPGNIQITNCVATSPNSLEIQCYNCHDTGLSFFGLNDNARISQASFEIQDEGFIAASYILSHLPPNLYVGDALIATTFLVEGRAFGFDPSGQPFYFDYSGFTNINRNNWTFSNHSHYDWFGNIPFGYNMGGVYHSYPIYNHYQPGLYADQFYATPFGADAAGTRDWDGDVNLGNGFEIDSRTGQVQPDFDFF